MILAHIPTALLAVVLASVVLPAVSAAIHRLHWDSSVTGVITGLLSTATGFFTEWVHAGDGFDWKTAAVTSLASWLVAVVVGQKGILSGTALEARLLLLGNGAAVNQGEPDPTVGIDTRLVTGTLAPEQTAPAPEPQPAAPEDPAALGTTA